MKSNVFIAHRRAGKLVECREVHNVWTFFGNQYLAEIVSLIPPTASPQPERTDRIKYMGLGIGGVLQSDASVGSPPISTAYPVGSAELHYPPDYSLYGYSNGAQYDQSFPTSPRIETLERPIRRTGSQVAYPGNATDRWFIEPPNLYTTHQTTQELTVHALLDAPSGDYIYGTFTDFPLSEAGLFTSDAADQGVPYQSLVAYVGFGTIVIDSTSELEFIWRVRFA
jgi:hypothetical protein